MPARWRKQANERGLAAVCQGPRGYELREGKNVLIRVSPYFGNPHIWTLAGWYWCGLGRNTFVEGKSWPTAEEAKADAMAYYREKRKEPR